MRGAPALAAVLACVCLLAGCGRRSFEARMATRAEETAVALFLIGDAGSPAPGGEPVLKALRAELSAGTEKKFVVFLGDNIYPAGMPDSTAPTRAGAEWIIERQMDVLRGTGVHGVFIPGNHDWAAGRADGWRAVVREGRFVDRNGGGLVEFLPRGGCPGPAVRDVGPVLRLIFLDTQWWLQEEGPKPVGDTARCAASTPSGVVAGIAAALRGAAGRSTVVVGHHPAISGGEHGGHFGWQAYLFPPYPLARRLGLFAPQDVNGPAYRRLRDALRRAFAPYPPDVYAAGHDHDLQVLHGPVARYAVVSGGGIYGHWTPVRMISSSLYARKASGFVRLDIRRDGWARLSVQVVDSTGTAHEDYSFWIRPNTTT
ncbi:MAG TPA: metallophosphoesterase [Longimicrobiaceae bacterium]|nr:metallophosphoesterase [Longimicrobiaceae bacterium]